ncbi:MAG: vWA domain-containing protein [Gemmataceae bacterium]
MPIFSCPRCASPLQIPEQSDGMMVGCPKCEQKLIIPAATAPPPPVGAFQVAPTARYSNPAKEGVRPGAPTPERALLHFVPVLNDEPGRLTMAKPLFFGLLGALGCLLAAILFEYPVYLLTPARAEKVVKPVKVVPDIIKVDVVFVLDVTGSMSAEIDGVRNAIEGFAGGLKREKLDAQIGLVYFRDRIGGDGDPPEDSKELLFDGKPFTRDPLALKREIGKLTAMGGGDAPESGLDALDYASKLPFRADAAKVLIFITDAPPKIPDKDNKDEKEVAAKLLKRNIQQLHLVVRDEPERYLEIQRIMGRARKGAAGMPAPRDPGKAAGPARGDPRIGKVFDLNDIAGKRGGLEKVLEGTTAEIADEARRQATVSGLAVEGEFEAGDAGQLIVVVTVWTAGLALGLTLALIFASRWYLRQSAFSRPDAAQGSLSVVVGLVGGLIAQGLVLLLS